MNINKLIIINKKKFEVFYKKTLNSYLSKDQLSQAMLYGSINGGKRIRPFLVSIFSDLANIKKNSSLNISAAVESIHSYSLIHDDLPSMDNDDYRRGKLSTHKKFNEAIAILAGDALHDLAFEIIADKKTSKNDKLKISLINILSKSLGNRGLAGGQSLDLLYENKKINLKDIIKMYEMKTSALFSFSCIAPYVLGKKSFEEIKFAEDYGRLFGLIFQIIDDLLDETEFKFMGKTPGKDKKLGKSNILSIKSKDQSIKFCLHEINKFEVRYKKYLNKKNILREIIDYNMNRINLKIF